MKICTPKPISGYAAVTCIWRNITNLVFQLAQFMPRNGWLEVEQERNSASKSWLNFLMKNGDLTKFKIYCYCEIRIRNNFEIISG
jgi:hypothetical protein